MRDVEGQWAPISVPAVTEAVVLGKAMPLVMDIQNWQGGHVGDGVHKQVLPCHVCLTSAHIYALSKTKCTENWGGGKHLSGSTVQDTAKWKLSLSLICMDICTHLGHKASA